MIVACQLWAIATAVFLREGSIAKVDNTPHIELCCIDCAFDEAWFMLRSQYWSTNSNFETPARQMHLKPTVRILMR